MSTATDRLASRIAKLEERLTAVERGSQMRRTSIEGGTLEVNDKQGTPVLSVGRTADGEYAVAGMNGGQVMANNLADLPEGSITETMIADDAISTPKLRANAVQADQLAADAIDGRTIRGVTLIGGEVRMEGANGAVVRIYEDPVAGPSISMMPQGSPPGTKPGLVTTYEDPDPGITDVGLLLTGPAVDDAQGTPERGAKVLLSGRSFNGAIELESDYIDLRALFATAVRGNLEVLPYDIEDDFGTGGGNAYVGADLTVQGSGTIAGDLTVNGTLTATGGLGGRALKDIKRAKLSQVTLLKAAPTVLPGTAIPVETTKPDALVVAFWAADFEAVVAGATAGVVQLQVDGNVVADPQAIFNHANVAAGLRQVNSTFTPYVIPQPGQHTLQLVGVRSGGGDDRVRVNALHTHLMVMIFD